MLGYELGGHGHGWNNGGIGSGIGSSIGSEYGGFDSSIGGHGLDLSGGYSNWAEQDLGSFENNHYGGNGWDDDK